MNKGLSKTYMKASVDICSKIMDSVGDSCPEESYPYIVENLVKHCINENIDPNLISRHSVVDVESKTITVNWTKVVNSFSETTFRLRERKTNGEERFYATVDQYESEIRKNVATLSWTLRKRSS